MQDALPTEAGAHAPLQGALPTLEDFSLCGNCDVDFPPLGFVPTSDCGKLCRCDTAVIELCFNEVVEHDNAIESNDDPEMPDLKFGKLDEFMLLQAQIAHSRRAAYGINGAKPGVQVSGSKPVKSRSEPSKTDDSIL